MDPGDIANLLSNSYDLYAFDQSEDLEWLNYEAGEISTIESAKGYLYSNSSDVTLSFAGTLLHSGTATADVDYVSSAEFPGWNLIGNPFACNAYLGSNQAFYKMNSEGTALEAATAGSAIAPLEGVFVEASASGTVTFSTTVSRSSGWIDMRVHNASGNRIDNAIVSFGDRAMLGKFMLKQDAAKLYLPQDGKDYAVLCASGQGEMPVNFRAVKNDTYTIGFEMENVAMGYLHLVDNLTGANVDLLQDASYSFEAKTTDYANRFRLVFSTESSTGSDTFGFVNAMGNFCIYGIEGTATVQVIDAMGRILSSESFNGSYEKQLGCAAGVYVIRLINGDNVRTQKVVVK